MSHKDVSFFRSLYNEVGGIYTIFGLFFPRQNK